MKKARTLLLGYAAFALVAASISTSSVDAQQRARVLCSITDNGEPASGSVSVRQGDREVAAGVTGTPIPVPNGTYEVVITLDGAMDRPTVTSQLVVARAQEHRVSASFQTAIVDVHVEAGGRSVAGMVTISRNGERVGTVGAGVPCHLSAGTYDVVVRYRGAERRFDGVALSAGERRALSASF